MIKTLQTIEKRDREPYRVPKSVRNAIPIQRIWENGIFQIGKEKYSKTYQITDVNYAVASLDAKQRMNKSYQELLNSQEPGTTTKITVFNRTQPKRTIRENLLPLQGNDLDKLIKGRNDILLADAKVGNRITHSIYATVSSFHDKHDDVSRYYNTIATNLQSGLDALDAKCVDLDARERLRVFYDFFHPGEEEHFRFNMKTLMCRGHSFLDVIAPPFLSYKPDYIRIGKRYGRVLYLKDYPTILKDSMIGEMCNLGRNLMLSIDMISIPTSEAVKEVNNILLGIATNAAKWTQKQNQNLNWSATLPYDIQQQQQTTEELLKKLTQDNQQLKFVTVTLIHLADSKKQLDGDTATLISTGRKYSCEFEVLKYRQREGMDTALPYGLRRIDALRTMTTENAATLTPFRAQSIEHTHGVYCGRNKITGNLIFIDRGKLQNGNSLILGISGSGKSVFAKTEMFQLAARKDCDVIIIDPEREYSPLVRSLHGEVITISANSTNHINALDMGAEYARAKDACKEKADFVTQRPGSHPKGLLLVPAGAAGAGRPGPGLEDRAVHRGPAGHLRSAHQREHQQLPDLLRHPGPGQLPQGGGHVGDSGLHLQPHPEERGEKAVHLCVHRRVLSAAYGRTQLRAGQLRAAGPVQSVRLRPEHAVAPVEHHPGAAVLSGQRPHGQRPDPLRRKHHPLC